MKIYALKYKDEYVEFSDKEVDLVRSYRFDNEHVKNDLKVISGTFVEDSAN